MTRHGRAGPSGGRCGPHEVRADDPERCKEYLSGIGELGTDVIDDLVARLREDRRAHGPEEGVADWMDGPLDEWLDHIDHGYVDLDEETMAAIAVGMHEVLSMRDAIILSMIADRDVCDRDALMAILTRPRTAPVSDKVRELLTEAFENRRGPDLTRCQAGVTMLTGMTRLMPFAMCAQQFASIAYILWWLGDCRAAAYALRSLAADERCTLAAIILSAAQRGLGPACAG